MRRIKEVLRMKFAFGMSERQIASTCSMARSTVAEYVRRAMKAGMSWPVPDDWDDAQLEDRLFSPKAAPIGSHPRPQPDFKTIHNELRGHKSVTLQLPALAALAP